MRQFGKILCTKNLRSMGLLEIEATAASGYPVINQRSLRRGVERKMFQQGRVQYPPVQLIYTDHASGGCVPICVAEISPPRRVRWIYLLHAHGGNNPIDLTHHISNPAHVHVCVMVYDRCASLEAAKREQETFFEAMDPKNIIPQANTLLIYGPHIKLAITQKAMVAVDFEA